MYFYNQFDSGAVSHVIHVIIDPARFHCYHSLDSPRWWIGSPAKTERRRRRSAAVFRIFDGQPRSLDREIKAKGGFRAFFAPLLTHVAVWAVPAPNRLDGGVDAFVRVAFCSLAASWRYAGDRTVVAFGVRWWISSRLFSAATKFDGKFAAMAF